MFATFANRRLIKFVSPYPDPRAEWTDAMSTTWDNGRGLLHALPPFKLVPHVLQMFATFANRRLIKFVSPYPDPRAEWTDAMSTTWDNGRGLLHALPPFKLVPRVLQMFATFANRRLIKFVLPYPDPREERTDAMSTTWGNGTSSMCSHHSSWSPGCCRRSTSLTECK